jgi:hypothetical protein
MTTNNINNMSVSRDTHHEQKDYIMTTSTKRIASSHAVDDRYISAPSLTSLSVSISVQDKSLLTRLYKSSSFHRMIEEAKKGINESLNNIMKINHGIRTLTIHQTNGTLPKSLQFKANVTLSKPVISDLAEITSLQDTTNRNILVLVLTAKEKELKIHRDNLSTIQSAAQESIKSFLYAFIQTQAEIFGTTPLSTSNSLLSTLTEYIQNLLQRYIDDKVFSLAEINMNNERKRKEKEILTNKIDEDINISREKSVTDLIDERIKKLKINKPSILKPITRDKSPKRSSSSPSPRSRKQQTHNQKQRNNSPHKARRVSFDENILSSASDHKMKQSHAYHPRQVRTLTKITPVDKHRRSTSSSRSSSPASSSRSSTPSYGAPNRYTNHRKQEHRKGSTQGKGRGRRL